MVASYGERCAFCSELSKEGQAPANMHPNRWHFTFSDVGGAVDGRPRAAFFGQAVEELELLNQFRSKHLRSPGQRLVSLFGHLERTTGAAAPRPCTHTELAAGKISICTSATSKLYCINQFHSHYVIEVEL